MAFAESTLWQYLTTIAGDGSLVEYYRPFLPKKYEDEGDDDYLEFFIPDEIRPDPFDNNIFKVSSLLDRVFYHGEYKYFRSVILRELRKLKEAQVPTVSKAESPDTFDFLLNFIRDWQVSQLIQEEFSVAEFVYDEAKQLIGKLGEQTLSEVLANKSITITDRLEIARRYRRLEALFYFSLFIFHCEPLGYEFKQRIFVRSPFNVWLTTRDLIAIASIKCEKNLGSSSSSAERKWKLNHYKNILEQIVEASIKTQIYIRLHLCHHQIIINSRISSDVDLKKYEAEVLSYADIPDDISLERMTIKRELSTSKRKILWLSAASTEKLLYTLNLFKPEYLDPDIAENLVCLNAYQNLLAKLNQQELLKLLETFKQSRYQPYINQNIVLSALHICQTWSFYFGEQTVYEWSDGQIAKLLLLFSKGYTHDRHNSFWYEKNAFFTHFFEYLFAIGRMNLPLINTLKKAVTEKVDYHFDQGVYFYYGKKLLIQYILIIQQKYTPSTSGRKYLIKNTECAFALMSLLLEEPTTELIGEISLKDTFLNLSEITQNFTVTQLVNLRAIANQSPYWRQQDLSLFEQLLKAKLYGENEAYTFEQLCAFLLNIPEAHRSYFSDWFPNLYQEIFSSRIGEFSENELQILKSIFLKAPNQFLFFSCEAVRAVDQEYERREQLKIDQESIEPQQNGVINMSKWYRPSRIKLPFTVRFVLATLAGFLLCFGLSALMPWLAIPAVVFSIAALCGGLAIAMPYLLNRYERYFTQLFNQWDKVPSAAQQAFGQTYAADLPSVVRFFIGVFGGFALGFAIGTVIFPGLGSALGAALGILIMTPISLAYPALYIFSYHSLDYLSNTPIYLRMFIGNLTGALIGALIGSIIPGVGTLIGALMGTIIGGGVGCLTGLWRSQPKNSQESDDSNWNELIERKKASTHETNQSQSDYYPGLLAEFSGVDCVNNEVISPVQKTQTLSLTKSIHNNL